MHTRKHFAVGLIGAILAAVLNITASSRAAGEGRINWYGYEEGMKLAQSRHQKIFLLFYADWCQVCKRMDRTTFASDAVQAYLNENFIPIRVDAEKAPQTATTYGVKGLPSSWFIDENGERISHLPGYVSPDNLLYLLKYIHTGSYLKVSFDTFLKTL